RQILQDEEPLLHDLVALLALDVADEADAAGVVLVRGVVKSLPLRCSDCIHGTSPVAARPAYPAPHNFEGKRESVPCAGDRDNESRWTQTISTAKSRRCSRIA